MGFQKIQVFLCKRWIPKIHNMMTLQRKHLCWMFGLWIKLETHWNRHLVPIQDGRWRIQIPTTCLSKKKSDLPETATVQSGVLLVTVTPPGCDSFRLSSEITVIDFPNFPKFSHVFSLFVPIFQVFMRRVLVRRGQLLSERSTLPTQR